ncbi:MAG: hypothetical protein ACT4PS_16385 [Betaproteobacteria bacterium]
MAQRVMNWEQAHARTFWSDGVWAGLIAGVVFMMMEMLLVWLVQGDSPWAPPRMMAAMVLGEGVLPPSADFSFGILMVAMMVHFVFSIVYGLIGAWIVHRFDMFAALMIGAVYGFAIYIVNFHVVVPAMFSWFVMARGAISILSHIAFGMVLAGSYIALRGRHVAH